MTADLNRALSGYRMAGTYRGDTMQAIALRELGDASRWVDLVSINGLVPPYISDVERSAGVLLAGDSLKVPSSPIAAYETASPNDLFGIDVSLVGGQLSSDGGDLILVSGVDNFSQAIRHVLDTDAGELAYHPDYGNSARRVVGLVAGPTAARMAAAYAKSAVESDPRVQRVSAARAVVSGDKISVLISAEAVSGHRSSIKQEL